MRDHGERTGLVTDPANDKLLLDRKGAVAWVTINNPERRNALSFEMFADLRSVLQRLDDDAAIRVIVISGAGGKAFVSGADISKFETERSSAEQVVAYRDNADRTFDAVRHLATPTIAMIRGWCIGGGVNLAVNCDLRICDENAIFGIPAARLGLGYSLKYVRALVQVVGPAAASEMLLTARHYHASEALRIGLVHHVVQGPLEDFTEACANEIAANAPLTLKQVKKAIEHLSSDPADLGEGAIDRLVDACNASQDYVEGRRAFKERRPPRFQGR